MRELAVDVFRALRGEGLARIDFFFEEGGRGFLCNEVNTIPGFTATSVYAKLFEASGIAYAELLDRLIGLALERPQLAAHLSQEILHTQEAGLGGVESALGSAGDATLKAVATLTAPVLDIRRLQPGDRLRATIHGRTQWFRIVGTAVSPEYVYQIKPGAMFPDYERFAIVWLNRRALEAALGVRAQLDLRLSVLHWYEVTLSLGAARGRDRKSVV